MPNNVETRLGRAVSKAGHVSASARAEIEGAIEKLNEAFEHIDTVVGGAHAQATKTEIEAMMISLDDAITESDIASREITAATAKLREVRGRLDRAMDRFKVMKAGEPAIPVAGRQSDEPDLETYEPPRA